MIFRTVLTFVFGIFLFATGTITATDTVTFRAPNALESQTVEGTIQSITGRYGLLLLPKGATAPVALPMDQVLRIDTDRLPLHETSDAAIAAARTSGRPDDYKRALDGFLELRKTEGLPLWKRQWMTGQIVECYRGLNQPGPAIQEFFLLCRMDPYSPYLSKIPLIWSLDTSLIDPAGRAAIEQIAASWLDPVKNPTGHPNPTGQLLAAGILLEGSSPLRAAAEEALRELVVCESPMTDAPNLTRVCNDLALLASAQLWRTRRLSGQNSSELDRLDNIIQKLSPELRGGPLLLLGKRRVQLGQKEAAQKAFLKASLLYPCERLAAEASLRK